MKIATLADLAEMLQITELEAETLRRRHRWPHVKAGRRNVRFTPQQIEQIIAKHTVDSNDDTARSVTPAIPGQTARSKARAS